MPPPFAAGGTATIKSQQSQRGGDPEILALHRLDADQDATISDVVHAKVDYVDTAPIGRSHQPKRQESIVPSLWSTL